MKPILYDKFEQNLRNLEHNGLGVLSDAISCVVNEKLNGTFTIEMKYPTSGVLFDELIPEMIIKADAGHKLKNQLFVISVIDTDMNGFVTVHAEHISYQTKNIAIRPTFEVENVSAQNALNRLNQSAIGSHDFTFESNIDETNNLEFDLSTHSNLRDGLSSIIKTWGGEYTFDNFDIKLNRRRGVPSNAVIAYGRNLIDLAQEKNISETATSIYPFAIHDDEIITVPEFVMHSANADNFANHRVVSVDFSREFERDEGPTITRLRELANQYMVDNSFGIPQVAITLSFVDLSKMAGGSSLEAINLGDTVPIRFNKLGIELNDGAAAKVVRVRWNVLLEKYDEIDIGTIRTSFSGQFNQMSSNMTHAGGTGSMNGTDIPGIIVSETEPPLTGGKVWIQIERDVFPLLVSNLYVNHGVAWRRLELSEFGEIRMDMSVLQDKIMQLETKIQNLELPVCKCEGEKYLEEEEVYEQY